MRNITKNKKTLFKALIILLLIIALPITLLLVRQSQDQRSNAAYEVPVYVESGGRVIMEAENYDNYKANVASHNWTKKTFGPYPEYPNITLKYMQSLPNINKTFYNESQSPELIYNIAFSSPGTYYVFLRGSAAGSNSDSVHVGIDGGQKKNMGTYYVGKYGYISDWSWDGNGGPIALNVPSAGLHTFHLWAREDGAKIDRIHLTKDANWKPSNHSNRGPGASDRLNPPPPPTCTEQAPLIEIVGETNQDVVPNESVSFTIRVTNRNSAECDPITLNMSNVFDPTTTDINYTFSEDTITLDSGETKNVTALYTPNQSANGQTFTAIITASEGTGGQGATISVTLNVAELTVVTFNRIILHGIGIGGDNANPNGPGNPNPNTTTKTLDVAFYDSQGNLVTEASGNINYSGSTKYFSGTIPVGSVLNGLYSVKVKTHKYLWIYLDGLITIVPGDDNLLPNSTLIVGDINSDEQTDLQDYDILIGCYSDLLPANDCDNTRKFNADLTDDGNVNQDDYNLLLREWSNQPGA